MIKMLNLRYSLIPYIYSEAWQVTENGSTMMRPLVMDFSYDVKALNQPYEYMFGKSFLVAPVTEPGTTGLNIYLPSGSGWYDFWSGQKYDGGQTIKAEAPLDKIPLFVRAGSVIPLGKRMQYTGQFPADTLEIRIYKGANGTFSLYEDENDNYNYEKGAFSLISFDWNDASGTLTIGKRTGEFPGIIKSRVFRILLVSDTKGNYPDVSGKLQKELSYDGRKTRVVFR